MSIQLKHQITSSISECLRGFQEGRNLDFLLYRIECILCLVNEALSSGNHDNLLDVCDIRTLNANTEYIESNEIAVLVVEFGMQQVKLECIKS